MKHDNSFLRFALLAMLLPVIGFIKAQDFTMGEYAFIDDGTPLLSGQCVKDHLFMRNAYDDLGYLKTFDDVVSFKSDSIQVVEFWLDDDEIYLNRKVQALIPVPCYIDGNDLYSEVTYSAVQFNLYLPMQMKLVKYKFDGEKKAVEYQAGNRLPSKAKLQWAEKPETKIIDGIEYRVYIVIVYNDYNEACHFSGNENAYRANGGPLKKDDACLFRLAIQNDDQENMEGQLADMIIANQFFDIREADRDGWNANEALFFYGTGGNNESQRFHFYNRVSIYGSAGILGATLEDGDVFFANGLYYEITSDSTVIVTCRRDSTNYTTVNSTNYSGNIIIPKSVIFNGVNYTVNAIGGMAFHDCHNLISITIPNTVTYIGSCSFRSCTGLTEIKIPNSVRFIYNGAFAHCTGLTALSLPNSLESISDAAFSDCTGLTCLTIPSSIKYMDYDAFGDCYGLTDVYSYIKNPNTILAKYMFNFDTHVHVDSLKPTLHIPKGSYEYYRVHPCWGPNFSSIVEMDSEPAQPGDINGDNSVNISDVNDIIEMILKGTSSNPAADVNGDGSLNVSDINAIIAIILNS